MRILGIETSCDETAVAVIEGKGDQIRIIDSLVASQIKDHAKYGGVVPEIAARKHVDVLFGLLKAIGLERSGALIDVIAVTQGPGLSPALRVGLSAAKTFATLWNKPIVGVNHLEGHVYSVLLGSTGVSLSNQMTSLRLSFPSVCLLVSGGHTEIVLMKDHGVYEHIGETRDDAAGEAFDKVAKLLSLGYPGGPIVSELASKGNPQAINFPRPMIDSGDFDFSFSGLKTAVLYELQGNKVQDTRYKDNVCASFQEAVVDVLVSKTMKAVDKYQPKSVILGGGVSANELLRSRLSDAIETRHALSLRLAPIEYTGDNAVMIAVAGYFRAGANQYSDLENIKAEPNMKL
ncbi:MAG: tRNA (adenosine(37)-N6)-threonylcarbamoyltransferase complex transferase subunit TsaD [Candidatus Uhrbacteria bacterium]